MILSPEQRRALSMLSAAGQSGCTEYALIAQGFGIDMLAGLIRNGLATVWPQRTGIGRKSIDVARMGITEVGRKALLD